MSDETELDAFANRAEIEAQIAGNHVRQAPNGLARQPVPAPGPALNPRTVIKLSRQRLRDVRRELKVTKKQLRALEKEERQLARLLDAADGKNEKPANVRPIRASG